ncbi:MAG: OmpH family outer membrane protein [Bacteroidales bacterium]|nr:OmpH family outer membrane protein [Bacteroidales bacterium]
MKNISLIINAVLFVALGILYYLHFTSDTGTIKNEEPQHIFINENDTIPHSSRMAFVNLDSLLLNYRLSEDLNDNFLKRQERLKVEFATKAGNFEKEAQMFQEKLNRGGFLTQQRAEEEQQRLLMEQQKLQNLEYELSNKLVEEQQKMNLQLYDSITNLVKEYNNNYGYEYILGVTQAGGLLYANQKYNITDTIVNLLNERYLNQEEK